MLSLGRLKRKILCRGMQILGFGGMVAYCIACSTPAQKPEPQLSPDVGNAQNDNSITQTTETDTANQADIPNPSAAADTANQADTSNPLNEQTRLLIDYDSEKLPDPLYEEVKKKYNYKYIRAKSDYLVVRSNSHALISLPKLTKRVFFPSDFRMVLTDTNKKHYALFNDGSIKEMPDKIFEAEYDKDLVAQEVEDLHCDKRYACIHPKGDPLKQIDYEYDPVNDRYVEVKDRSVESVMVEFFRDGNTWH